MLCDVYSYSVIFFCNGSGDHRDVHVLKLSFPTRRSSVLRLSRPFDFRDPTFVLTARQNYATIADASNPQLGALAAAKTETSIGEIGALVNWTWSQAKNNRSVTNLGERRYAGRSAERRVGEECGRTCNTRGEPTH